MIFTNPVALMTLRRLALRKPQRIDLLSGFRENTWFLQTKGTDYELEPPSGRRVSVVRTAYIEADGEALPEPDPANRERREFSWMTVHQYTSDRPVANVFKDVDTLKEFNAD